MWLPEWQVRLKVLVSNSANFINIQGRLGSYQNFVACIRLKLATRKIRGAQVL